MNDRVLIARKKRELTQERLAALCGVNHADINRIEKHGWIPPASIRQSLAEALGVSEEDLFGRLAHAEQ